MHEIITLQLGQRSNYVATHFWNTQESYFTYTADEESLVDHDVHFRPGVGVDGSETFMPRTLIYDLKGGFGTLRRFNALYEIQEDAGIQQGLWNGPAVIQRQAAIDQSPYQKSLENGLQPPSLTKESVRYWSDFNRVYFHPKSIVQLNEYELGSTLMPFEKWGSGEELFDSLDKEHDLLDRDLRPFAEEADQMQGIQVITSLDDAWGGFSARYMDRLRDEYGKTTLWLWGVEDGISNTPRDKQLLKLSNTARSIAEVSSQASIFIPMSIPPRTLPSYVSLDKASHWHVSALFSTAMESMTLPSRLRRQDRTRESLDEIAGALNVNGNQNIVNLQMSIGSKTVTNVDQRSSRLEVRAQSRDTRMPSQNGLQHGLDSIDDEIKPLDIDFLSQEQPSQSRGRRTEKKTHVFGQVEAFRGDEVVEERELDDFDGQERARRRAAGLPIIHKIFTPMPFSILDSFPPIYSQIPASTSASLSVRTALTTDSKVATRIKMLRGTVSQWIGLEDRETLGNKLGDLAEGYEDGWDSGSDEDDD